jgi:hypothetical protein
MMKSAIWHKYRIRYSLLILGIFLLCCSCTGQSLPSTGTPLSSKIAAPSTPVSTIQPDLTSTIAEITTPVVDLHSLAPTAESTPAAEPTPSQPFIMNTYKISDTPYHPGGMLGVLLVLPDQIWVASMLAGIMQIDPHSGEVMATLPGIDAQRFYDMQFDGKRVWVLATDGRVSSDANILYVIDLSSGEVLKKIPITGEGDYGSNPTRLGVSPGKIWVNFGTVDTETFEYTSYPSGLPSDANFAFDGEQWMWITGSWCHGCDHDLWLVNTNNPVESKGEQESGVLGTGVLGNPLALLDGKMWLLATYYTSNGTAYFLDAYDIHKTDRPALHIDMTNEIGDSSGTVNITVDDHMVWLESAGTLYYIDGKTGQKMGELTVGEYIEGMQFDGTSLWVLSSDTGLLQVFLPWEP